jgi:hypothetical protein
LDLRDIVWGVWSGFTWLRIGTVGGMLWMRWWNFGLWRHGVSSYSTATPARKTWNCAAEVPTTRECCRHPVTIGSARRHFKNNI